MPNLASFLKSEISRLARKELRQEIEPIKRSLVHARSEIAALKKAVKAAERELKAAGRPSKKVLDDGPVPAPEKFRFRASTMKGHRAKIGVSAKDYGRLLGASMLSVYKWEEGKVAPRPKMLSRIAEVLRMGKREALRRLTELQST